MKSPTIDKVQSVIRILDSFQFAQEAPAQIREIDRVISLMMQAPINEIESIFVNSPVSKINWASHLILLDSS